jgi:putative ABC transport system permease protein
MFQNYFKTTFRHIRRSKVNFGFKLGGLALALFSLLVIVLYISYQWSFDRFHHDYANVYRVNSNRAEDGKIVPYSMVPPAIGPALKGVFPEIVAYTRLGVSSRVMVRYREKLFRFAGFADADSSVFNVLAVNFLRGDNKALHQPGSVVLTQSVAKQIFGDEDPIDKVIESPDHSDRTLHVTGVIDDFPSNSHLFINALMHFGSLQNTDLDSWQITWDGSVNLYVRLAAETDPDRLSKEALPLLIKNLAKTEDGSERNFSIYFQPIRDIFLDKPLKMEFNKKGNPLYVYIFSLLGIFLMVIAGINYVNLSIADFDSRTREMGIRKVLGARKIQIGFHVVFEALIISGIALVIAVALLYEFFPLVSAKLDTGLRFGMLTDRTVIASIGVLLTLLIAFSSAYPWYRLSSRKATEELKSNSGYGTGMGTGKVLLVIQYGISIVCICCTAIVGNQLAFVKNTDVGYNRSGVVSLVMPDEYPAEKVSVLKNELGRLAGVEAISYSYYLMPVSTYFKDWYRVERNGRMEKILLNEMFVDHDYFETMGITVIAGRNFEKTIASDARTAFIINETAAKELGWSDPVGKKMKWGYTDSEESWEGTVIGVVKDFNTLSLHRKIEPVILRLPYDNWPGNALNIKVQGNLSETLPAITSTYEKLLPGLLADARVLEDLHRNQYKNEENAFASLQIGTIVIILISVMGIFSLSLYMSMRRMKEFGIRKVLGATVRQIASLHVGYFLRIGLLANIIALPVSYWLMKEWLENFAYRTEVSSLVFVGVTFISFLLIIISGAYSAWKAGRMNPVDVIRNQ